MLWHAYALLSHGGDRIGLPPWRRSGRSRPCQNPDDVLLLLERTDEALWAAAALSACAETGLLEQLKEPRSVSALAQHLQQDPAFIRALVSLLAGHGLVTEEGEQVTASPALAPFTGPQGAATFRAALRAPLLQMDDFRHRVSAGTVSFEGWQHTDDAVIEAQGALTQLWTRKALPKLRFLPGLAARLEAADGAALDVGAGAAGLSITLCQTYPNLRVVALEPAERPAAIGEREAQRAGLGERIEIRRERVEHLREEGAFDLAFLPQMFLPDAAWREATARLLQCLRPGGWLLVAALADEGHTVTSAVSRLKNLLWGGQTRSLGSLAPQLAAAGFDPVIRAPGGARLRMICARRPILRELP